MPALVSKAFLDADLETDPVPAALAVFYVFKDESLRQQFFARRYRRPPATPRKRVSPLRFEEHRELLAPFLAPIAQLGRLSEADEFPPAAKLVRRLGSLPRTQGSEPAPPG